MSADTVRYKRLHGLTTEQRNAIELAVLGKRDREIAEAVGVTRVTVTRWRNYDPSFRAELNRRRAELWGCCLDRLRGVLPLALDRLEAELGEGASGYRVALELVRLTGLAEALALRPVPGPTDATVILDDEARSLRGDPVADLLSGGRVSEPEREAAHASLTRKAAALPETDAPLSAPPNS